MFGDWYRTVFAHGNRPLRSQRAAPRRTRLSLEPLEVRATPAIITVTSVADSIAVDGFITLREALTAASTNSPSGDAPAGDSGLDTIKFNIAGAPGTVHKIQPSSAFPTITDPVFIDGYSQLGASPNTLTSGDNAFLAIELDGTLSGFNAGLTITAGNSTVQGLVINSFKNEGILVISKGGNTIRGNFLGTDQTGKVDRGNGIAGVGLLTSNNTVGGLNPADRNLISGNDFTGITLVNAGVTGNKIRGNFIGTDDAGTENLGNNGAGVRIANVAGTIIGGAQAGAGNVIAFNSGAGIQVGADAGLGNIFVGNSIHSNGGLGIDLGVDGPTANDALDADAGPNGLQNFPVLTAATTTAAGTVIKGTLSAQANTSYRIEFFSSDRADPSGFGEGQHYLGFINVSTGAAGSVSFTFNPAASPSVGTWISATAIDPLESTSEFSQAIMALPAPGTATLDAGSLIVSGTSNSDVIVIDPNPMAPSQLRVRVNYKTVALKEKANVQRILASGLGGNDTITVNALLEVPAELHGNGGSDRLYGGGDVDQLFGESGDDFLYGRAGSDYLNGGAGNDRVEGGAGNDLVLGGIGSDKLFGDYGNDILIGGLGGDSLDGGTEDDILIGGITNHDANSAALLKILSEWILPTSASQRINHLKLGGGLNNPFFLTLGGTVKADGAIDRLTSGPGFDWLLRSNTDGDLLLDVNADKDRVDNF
jgi:Ca2+-binding RTX toxin-like protein